MFFVRTIKTYQQTGGLLLPIVIVTGHSENMNEGCEIAASHYLHEARRPRKAVCGA